LNISKVFLTDSDFEVIFGSGIAGIVRSLGEFGEEKCSACKGKCCREIRCGFYLEKFSFCPIYEIRPRECRYHFCHEILNNAPLDQDSRDLLNKPIKDLVGSERGKLAELFPTFPHFMVDSEGLTLLGIKEKVGSIMETFGKGEISEEQARDILTAACLGTGG
jgi:hypothetical protein